jgi:ribosome-binding factor A
MVSRRQERIAEMLMEELSILISSELSDPRLDDALVSVTDVQLSPDLQNARVYMQHQAEPRATRGIFEALRHSHSFLRRQLAENLNLRMMP